MKGEIYWDLSLKKKAQFVLDQLEKDYPVVDTPLKHSNAFELLISVMFSPQTTDEVTNSITPKLFKKYPTPETLANAHLEELRALIRPINFHKTKAERAIKVAQTLLNNFDRKVPASIELLTTLPGVGRKVANVLINDWHADSDISRNKAHMSSEYDAIPRGSIKPEGIVVDTHVIRVSRGLGLTDSKTPEKIEQDLMELFKPDEWPSVSLRMIFHGRKVFQARNPKFKDFPIWRNIYK